VRRPYRLFEVTGIEIEYPTVDRDLRALPLVEKGPVLIGVGALHLPGESGLVQLFRDAGFTVNRLY
jgi:uncharacterized protein YbaP (TraB family)